MVESTVTQKGQTTVPLEMRLLMGAAPGTRLVWHGLPDGTVVVRAKSRSIMELAGSLKPAEGLQVPTEDLNAWR